MVMRPLRNHFWILFPMRPESVPSGFEYTGPSEKTLTSTALSRLEEGKEMKVLIIRHAQSQNNIVQAQVHTQLANKEISASAAQEQWLANRSEDPGLSPDGLKQVMAVEMYAAKVAKKHPQSKIAIYTSPMVRACQTAQAACKSLADVKPQLHPDLYEVGGMYKAVKGPSGKFEKHACQARSAADIAGQFGFGTGKCSPSGPWDGARGYETSSGAVERAKRVAGWLRTSASQEVGENGIIMIVSHADFIALLIATLCNVNMSGKGLDANPDMDVSSHGISEGTLDDEIENHCSSIYTRFRVSLACTTMLEITGGQSKVLWMNKKKHLEGKNCAIM